MESTKHPLSTFYPDIPPDILDMFSSFTEASFGQEPDPSQFSTKADFEKGLLSQVEAELHKAPLTEETIEKCAFFVFNFLLDHTQFNYANMYDVATQVRDLAAVLDILPTQTEKLKKRKEEREVVKSYPFIVPPYGRLFLLKSCYHSDWYGIPKGGEAIREELFFLIDQKFFQGNVVPPTYRCSFQNDCIGSLHRYVPHLPFEDLGHNPRNKRSFWNAPDVRMNALLHLLVNYMDESEDNYGAPSGSPPLRLISFDGESILTPRLQAGPRVHPLLYSPATNAILDDPFSPEEMTKIDAIKIEKLSSLLQEQRIERQAIVFIRSSLKLLHLAVAHQREGAKDPITLRDLLVITNISNPTEISDKGGNHFPGKQTFFYTICRGGCYPEEHIRAVFATIIEMKKEAADKPAGVPNPYWSCEIKRHVWDHYRNTCQGPLSGV